MYKSVRLLNEAIHAEMDKLRKNLMRVEDVGDRTDSADALESLNELRKLAEELVEKANRPTLEEVQAMKPADYVATMKPLVANYHRSLMTADLLAQCLSEDLRANAVVLFLIGDGNTVVRAAHDPNKPEAALVVEALVNGIDETFKKVAEEGLAAAEAMREGESSGE